MDYMRRAKIAYAACYIFAGVMTGIAAHQLFTKFPSCTGTMCYGLSLGRGMVVGFFIVCWSVALGLLISGTVRHREGWLEAKPKLRVAGSWMIGGAVSLFAAIAIGAALFYPVF